MTLTGRLLQSPPGTPLGDRLFYVDRGRRHHVQRYDRLHLHDFSSTRVTTVPYEELLRFRLAGPVPLDWPDAAWDDPPRNRTIDLREIATSRLRGSGIEFGAGTSPLGVPLACDVAFADFLPEEQLKSNAYAAQGPDFVALSYVMSMEDMACVADHSADFIIAAHVIEHLRNPLKAIGESHRKLRRGGYLVLIVPDQARSFDRYREVTSLSHIISDYETPDPGRDIAHYYDFFSHAVGFVSPDVPIDERVRRAIEKNEDLHFHTWTYDSFLQMVEYARENIAPWSEVWSQPSVIGPEGFEEFYFVLRS